MEQEKRVKLFKKWGERKMLRIKALKGVKNREKGTKKNIQKKKTRKKKKNKQKFHSQTKTFMNKYLSLQAKQDGDKKNRQK